MKTRTKLLLGLGAVVAGLGVWETVSALAPAQINGCQYNATPPSLSDLQTTVIQCNSAGSLLTTATIVPAGTQDVNLTKVGGTGVSLGQAAAASSIPVVLPAATNVPVTGTFWQATQPVSIASAQVASGAIASGAYASGSIASGAVASGAYASGALAAGSIVDGADVTQGTKADAAATATDTTPVSIVSILKEISAKEQAPASRAVTNTGTFATQSAITAASGAIASGAIASGAVASGAIASGAVASGAYAAGSISDGADVTQGAKADAKSTATDTTAVSIMSVLKEISAMAQAPAAPAPSAAAGIGIAAVVSGSLETGHVLKNGAGNLYGVEVVTTSAAGYLEVFNSTTVPAAGAVTPVASCYVVAFGTCALNFSPPLVMSTGISVAFSASTTPFTKTDSATAFLSGQVQ